MTEEEARAALDVPRETQARLEAFIRFLTEENARQNLVSRASLEQVWARHIYDSAQLLRFVPADTSRWLDLGTGAGFPGLIVAALFPGRFTLIEARRLRVEFLRQGAEILGIEGRVQVVQAKVEAAPDAKYGVISARAFAPLDKLLLLGERFATPETQWLLPKGRNAKSELEAAHSSWQGDFSLEPSLTDGDAQIIVARGVRRKSGGKRTR
ncbi:16S rRNA (guanine(527)-N(7))-methyltransferase RsmG [Sphingomonas parva]|uniref:Ribosomal RNA small subunit methyltransferase G n=1 Tax=Sphingomonas parva TaxID=2555898 RepID=A0A4Y8ZW31_9SPHN|nr:16S rRNA (guanine(527)-N(7))-methyltransferase RsmG [Sphingomonas parva]TFI59542.1 16S rRNA (guanine(527)-N(7))-methyltransferase RsmG [Sphingomonas parva]